MVGNVLFRVCRDFCRKSAGKDDAKIGDLMQRNDAPDQVVRQAAHIGTMRRIGGRYQGGRDV